MFFPEFVTRALDELTFRYLSRFKNPLAVLRVSEIEYASPGNIDVTGIGEGIKALTGFAQFLIERHDSKETRKQEREMREQEIEMREQELIAKKIKTARAFARAAKEVGSVEDLGAIMRLVSARDRALTNAIETGRITEVRMLDDGK